MKSFAGPSSLPWVVLLCKAHNHWFLGASGIWPAGLRCLWAVPRDSALSQVPSLAARGAATDSPVWDPDSFIHPPTSPGGGGGRYKRVAVTGHADAPCLQPESRIPNNLTCLSNHCSQPIPPPGSSSFLIFSSFNYQHQPQRHPNLVSRDTTPLSALALSTPTPGTLISHRFFASSTTSFASTNQQPSWPESDPVAVRRSARSVLSPSSVTAASVRVTSAASTVS